MDELSEHPLIGCDYWYYDPRYLWNADLWWLWFYVYRCGDGP